MEKVIGGCMFPLTSFQIGDLQSYLSHLSLFLAPESDKIYILVDNHPWLKDLGLRSAHLWQLMVTKSRLSPFANSRARPDRERNDEIFKLSPSSASLSQKMNLLPVKNLRKALLLNSELRRTLHGFIVFEVAWTDVRGINYLNELQTDTSLALEAKFMRRWEFDSIAQAEGCLSSWFSGTQYEWLLLKDYLNSVMGDVFYDAQEDDSSCDPVDKHIYKSEISREGEFLDCLSRDFSLRPAKMENGLGSLHTMPPRPYQRGLVTNSISSETEIDTYLVEETCGSIIDPQENMKFLNKRHCKHGVEATKYRDVLILFRFNDSDLPFKLRQIIMSDLRLLRLLEFGLPSWVIFLQSYPVFCHLYRPWMCPLVRALYVLISTVTVLIGFYDLYKNVPVLKATASGLCGPLMDWIDTWDMVSRIKYLGTMLFLQNIKRGVECFMAFTRTARSFFAVFAQPLTEPLLELLNCLVPFWNVLCRVAGNSSVAFRIVIGTSSTLMANLAATLLQPVWLIVSFYQRFTTSLIYPIFWILWEMLYIPVRLLLSFSTYMTLVFTFITDYLGEIWQSLSSIFQFAKASEVAVGRIEVSMWPSLWNDLFSQVFRAVRSILNGLVAFFAACNRHRLSIYNHTLEFMQRLSGQIRQTTFDLKDCKQANRAQTLSEARR